MSKNSALDDHTANMRATVMEEERTSYSLRYVGRRFIGARLPLDVLGDLPALRDLITALAKQDFRRENPDRKRVPQGFDKSISFAMTSIKDGSAVPVFELDYELAQQNLPNIGGKMDGIVSKAFQRAAKLFDDAGNDIFPHVLPQDAIVALTKLGANIQDDERIEFNNTADAQGNVICLDTHRRKALLTRLRETYTTEFEGVGTLTGIDASHNTIQVQTEKFGELRLSLDGVAMPAEEFDGNLHSLVEFSLSIALDANDDFRSVESVHSVDLVKPYDDDLRRCVARLQELAKIKKGWLGEQHGEQVVHLAGIRATQLVFMRADLAKYFRIFPTEDGGISIEFDKGNWSFAVEIMPDGALELDASSDAGEVFEAQEFKAFSTEFFEAFDAMITVVAE